MNVCSYIGRSVKPSVLGNCVSVRPARKSISVTTGKEKLEMTRTAYLGPEASFSHQAAVNAIPKTDAIPLASFKAILKAIQDSSKPSDSSFDFAVLPVENSTNGSVVQALDLIAQCGLDPETSNYPDVEVIDENYLAVHHCLFVSRAWAESKLDQEDSESLPFDLDERAKQTLTNGHITQRSLKTILPKLDIKTLYTHPQVWGQCNNILSAHLPPGLVDRVDMSSTSAAAAFVAQPPPIEPREGGIAAISSSLAGKKHVKDLICIAQNIEDEPGANTTRFLVLRNRNRQDLSLPLPSSHTGSLQIKSLWEFTIAHSVPGSLAIALAIFAKHNFNLSAIQSRPRPKPKQSVDSSTMSVQDRNWRYIFFVECLHMRDASISQSADIELASLLDELKTVTEQVSLLGSWRDRLS